MDAPEPFITDIGALFRHSARSLPLNYSMNELSVGFPGREKSSATSFFCLQIEIAEDEL